MSHPVHLFKLGSRPLVGGLTWRALNAAENQRQQIRSLATIVQSKFGVVYESPVGQRFIGVLSSTAPVNARNAYSAASVLCDARPEEAFMYVERLPNNTYWLVAIKEGVIAENTDLIAVEDELKPIIDDLLTNALSAEGEDRYKVYYGGGSYPTTALIDRFDPLAMSFHDLVEGRVGKGGARVKQLYGVTPAAVAMMVSVVVLTGVAYAGMLYWKKLEEQRQFEEMQRVALEQQQIQERLANMTELRVVQAAQQAAEQDTKTPLPSGAIDRCLQVYSGLAYGVAGWEAQTIACNPANATVETNLSPRASLSGRPLTTNRMLVDAASEHGWQASPDLDGSRAGLNLPPQESLATRKGLKIEQMPLLREITVDLASHLQILRATSPGLNYSLSTPAPRMITYLDPAMEQSMEPTRFKPIPPERGYQTGSVQISGNGLWLLQAMKRFDWPFLTVSRVEFRRDGRTVNWKLEMTYVAANT